MPLPVRTDTGTLISLLEVRVHLLEEKVDSLEHYSNQASILLDTLGNIMEELKNHEL